MDDAQYERLINLILEMKSDQAETKAIVSRNTVILAEHIRRTEAAEANIEILKADAKENIEVIRAELEPMKDHMKAVGVMLKLALGSIGVAGTIATIVEVIRNLHSI